MNKYRDDMGTNHFYLILGRLKPEMFFIVTAVLFGFIILFITPPFQVPDEINHFYRAWQVSEGRILPEKKEGRLGGNIPASLVKISTPFSTLGWSIYSKTSFDDIKKQFRVKLEAGNKSFADFPNTAVYSPVSYLPQAMAIFTFRNLGLPPMLVFYLARLISLAFWLTCLYYAIKITPVFKWLFVALALLPMSLFVNMSLSADVVTNSLAFLWMAHIFRLAYSDHKLSFKSLIFLSLTAVLIASAKLVYIPIVMLFLIIPRAKFRNTAIYYTSLAVILLLSAGAALFWSNVMNRIYLSYSLYNPLYRDSATICSCADVHAQMQFITGHGLYFARLLAVSLYTSFNMYFQGYIGTLGWLETKLPVWIIYLSYTALMVIAFTGGNNEVKVKKSHKVLMLLSLIITICLVLISQYLIWDCVGGNLISNLQGRYFIPVFPVLFMLFYNIKLNNKSITILAVLLVSTLCLSITLKTLYVRYYQSPHFKNITVKCDAERLTTGDFFQTDVPFVFMEKANTRSSDKAHSGKFSAKLNADNPFGFTTRLYHCKSGDIIKAEVWRLGKGGLIIMTGSQGEFYVGGSSVAEKDSTGWEHLIMNYIVPENMVGKETGIYVYNKQQEVSYFDDMQISVMTVDEQE